ncbi:hypothetical protein [Pseudomonas canadensis]|uniref:hypothetical protein n=1 Tax=Pseudomonas canadensis TaxID=915099 RepID=UPI0027374E40|nr:hypothetical protein [Pseudomonas canadensis]WLH32685.1 hypothetical protein PSH56_13450 [Pseudomonas canadensis]
MIDLSKLEKIKTPADIAQEVSAEEARRYLRDTDWYVLRQIETGQAIPDDIKSGRKAARDTISTVAADA